MRNWQTQLDTVRRDHRLPLALTAFFALLLLWSLIDFFTLFFQSTPTVTKPKPVVTVRHVHNLADLHLFGLYSAQVLPNTDLQLTLEGTVVLLDAPSHSQAVISSPGQPAKVYQVGDALPGNATITRIDKDYVVLNDNGSLQKLPLPIQTATSTE